MHGIDIKLFFLINRGVSNILFDALMPALTSHGYFLAIPFFPYVLYRGAKVENPAGTSYLTTAIWAVIISLVSFPTADWIGNELKDFIARTRPCLALEGVRLLVECPVSYSMPSGHAVSSFAFAAPLFYLTRRFISLAWRLYPVILAVFVAFSRVYVGVHYPSDILVGALLGIMVSMILIMLYIQFRSRRRHA